MRLIERYENGPIRAVFMQDRDNYWELTLGCRNTGKLCTEPTVSVRWGRCLGENERGELEVWIDHVTGSGRYRGAVSGEPLRSLEETWRHALAHPGLYVAQARLPAGV